MAAATRAGPARALPQRDVSACVVSAHALEAGIPDPPYFLPAGALRHLSGC